MRIDELIEQLQKIREEHGNLQIRTYDEHESIFYVDDATVLTYDSNGPSWATDSDLSDGELYVFI